MVIEGHAVVVAKFTKHNPDEFMAATLNEKCEQEHKTRQCDSIFGYTVRNDTFQNVFDIIKRLT